ncbi:hypothetical protein BofuT4_P014550.1 [Botrytis cinerea T4]|uniref:Uncharacterized protein n=1 Tax=Botryotinia fuckeliana (strain T4) TaxID=999810 RepID=G2XN71_BOTF4|nr:hypothetical protein BofuT4_P014550.1 [Botrytis cinerea T4]
MKAYLIPGKSHTLGISISVYGHIENVRENSELLDHFYVSGTENNRMGSLALPLVPLIHLQHPSRNRRRLLPPLAKLSRFLAMKYMSIILVLEGSSEIQIAPASVIGSDVVIVLQVKVSHTRQSKLDFNNFSEYE